MTQKPVRRRRHSVAMILALADQRRAAAKGMTAAEAARIAAHGREGAAVHVPSDWARHAGNVMTAVALLPEADRPAALEVLTADAEALKIDVAWAARDRAQTSVAFAVQLPESNPTRQAIAQVWINRVAWRIATGGDDRDSTVATERVEALR